MTSTQEISTDEHVTQLSEWAREYPSARFIIIAIAPDGTDAAVLGWGLALPDHVFTHLDELRVHGTFRTTDHLVRLLSHTMNIRIAWIDPEPPTWPEP
jgi:hypothetical protein